MELSRKNDTRDSVPVRGIGIVLGFWLLVYGFSPGVFAQSLPALSGEAILKKVDEQATVGTLRYRGVMEIQQQKKKLVKEFNAVAEGDAKAFVEFTNPEDRGTRYLKIDKDLWMYFPDEQETIKISGHLLKEGMMGSDISYEDALESGNLLTKYAVAVSGTETIDGRPCYVVELSAITKTAPYDKQKLWIDGERFVVLKSQMLSKSGKLIKESQVLQVSRFGNRWFATEIQMEDKLKKGGGTTFRMTDLEFDVTLPQDQFTLRRLSR
ncbi:MAG: outer membrane lipoprotein-sorting protein [Termitinemataceae bacterium]